MANVATPITLFEAGVDNYLDAIQRINENGQTTKQQRVVTEDQTGNNQMVLLDYYNPGDSQNRLRYEGVNTQGAATGDATWTIRQFTWTAGPVAGDFVVTKIQVLTGVWDNRTTLPWV